METDDERQWEHERYEGEHPAITAAVAAGKAKLEQLGYQTVFLRQLRDIGYLVKPARVFLVDALADAEHQAAAITDVLFRLTRPTR